jgi:hypothetical protein
VSGCGAQVTQTQEIRDTKIVSDFKKLVQLATRNPDTTKFKNFRASMVSLTDGREYPVACGYVLAENGFGGFGGYRLFSFNSGEPAGVFLQIVGEPVTGYGITFTPTFQSVSANCKVWGIKLDPISLD